MEMFLMKLNFGENTPLCLFPCAACWVGDCLLACGVSSYLFTVCELPRVGGMMAMAFSISLGVGKRVAGGWWGTISFLTCSTLRAVSGLCEGIGTNGSIVITLGRFHAFLGARWLWRIFLDKKVSYFLASNSLPISILIPYIFKKQSRSRFS